MLSKELDGVHEKRVLELATGSGSAVNFLPNDNHYCKQNVLSSPNYFFQNEDPRIFLSAINSLVATRSLSARISEITRYRI